MHPVVSFEKTGISCVFMCLPVLSYSPYLARGEMLNKDLGPWTEGPSQLILHPAPPVSIQFQALSVYHEPGTIPHFVASRFVLMTLEIGIIIISLLEGN